MRVWSGAVLSCLLGCGSLQLPDDLDGDGYTPRGGDCDDTDPTRHPDADEGIENAELGVVVGTGVDNNCDGRVDDGTASFDDDGDGFCEVAPCVGGLPAGDCDDASADTWPGAPDQVDGGDNDCDGTLDEGTEVFDDDGDGYCEAATGPCPDGSLPGDCDDRDAGVHPDAQELCDGRDEDCDGVIDDGYDNDGDGYPTAEVEGCGPDLDDQDAAVFPGAEELCDGVDNDQDGLVDEEHDLDGDGWVDANLPECVAEVTRLGGGDCDDTDPMVAPDRPELCNEIDDDCDGRIDGEDDPESVVDLDGDGHVCEADPGDCEGDPTRNVSAADIPDGLDNDCDGVVAEDQIDDDGDGWPAWEDCDDMDASTWPGAPEVCDGADNDCDGVVDDETGAQCEVAGM